ncbi:N-acetylglucosamine kinase [Streptomyces sp. NBC_00236]|uniref:N-acetylglucosamine kinase n=1 Tax=Streptomyces sp. NBC_00236 TaxID=2903639 RepID=UPI002E297046|nr:BadF/BadG/BcrA/BcrD ATPase family protein [Streptomyces sp. NBC_00236]
MTDHRLVLGIDAGGTSTRAVVTRIDGELLGRGEAGGGNPASHGQVAAGAQLAAALAQALSAVDPAAVVAGVAGIAGGRAFAPAVLEEVWQGAGLGCVPRFVGDALIAFVAGTPESSGTLLLSGTGAIACRVRDGSVEAVSDGLGWLLGDEGSGFWLGREAAKAVVHTLAQPDSRDPGLLGKLVTAELLGSPQPFRDLNDQAIALVERAQSAPQSLTRLAPVVNRAAEAGDPTALEIVREGARHLVATAARVHRAEGPIVLAGSVLTSEGILRSAVRELLAAQGDGPVRTAGSGAGAAAWMAAGEVVNPAEAVMHASLHAKFTGGNPPLSASAPVTPV